MNIEYVRVIDFGCGTGLVGESLRQKGLKDITGVDCSSSMLYEADKKQVYSDLEQSLLGGKDFLSSLSNAHKQAYDFVTAGGLIDNNDEDELLFDQMLL